MIRPLSGSNLNNVIAISLSNSNFLDFFDLKTTLLICEEGYDSAFIINHNK